MKRTLTCLFFLAVANLTFGISRFQAYLELFKDDLPTIAEMEYIKVATKIPGFKPELDAMIKAVRAGCTNQYWFDLDIETYSSATAAVLTLPDGKTIKLLRDGDEFYLEKGYFTVDQLKAEFPSGQYTVEVFFSDKTKDSKTFTLTDFSDSDYPAFVDGQLLWNGDYLNLQFSSVPDTDGEYEVEAVTIKDDIDLGDSWEHLSFPGQLTIDFGNRIVKGQHDVDVDVSARKLWVNGPVQGWLVSTANWFAFKKPMIAFPDEITKCTVVAGPKSDDDALTMSGRLGAAEEMLIFSDNLRGDIFCDTRQGSIGLDFPINSTTLKNGKFSSTLPAGFDSENPKATATFKYDAKTHTFVLTLKGYDLTGLSCPIKALIKIGAAYETQMEAHEPVVNGSKACSPQLIQGMADSLVVEKYLFTPHKQVGLDADGIPIMKDAFMAAGTFTLAGQPQEGQSLEIILGSQTISVEYFWFTPLKKPGVYACTGAPAGGSDAVVTAVLDLNKCTFAITIKSALIEVGGMTSFGLNVFGNPLQCADPINLGARYSYWDLTGYDQDGTIFTYQTRTGDDVEIEVEQEYPDIFDVEDGALAFRCGKSSDGAAWLGAVYLGCDHSAGWLEFVVGNDTTMWPAALRPGQTFTASTRALKSALELEDGVIWNIPQDGGSLTVKTTLAPKPVIVKIENRIYSTFKFDQTWTLAGTLKTSTDDNAVGTLKTSITQSCYAVPGVGIVKRDRKITLAVRTSLSGSVNHNYSQSCVLIDR